MRFAGKKLWLALAVLGVSGSALAQSTGEFASDGRRAEASPLKGVQTAGTEPAVYLVVVRERAGKLRPVDTLAARGIQATPALAQVIEEAIGMGAAIQEVQNAQSGRTGASFTAVLDLRALNWLRAHPAVEFIEGLDSAKMVPAQLNLGGREAVVGSRQSGAKGWTDTRILVNGSIIGWGIAGYQQPYISSRGNLMGDAAEVLRAYEYSVGLSAMGGTLTATRSSTNGVGPFRVVLNFGSSTMTLSTSSGQSTTVALPEIVDQRGGKLMAPVRLLLDRGTGAAIIDWDADTRSLQSYYYERLDTGIYFLGVQQNSVRTDQPGTQKYIPGQPNAFFDPSKPTIIYAHGWNKGSVTARNREGLLFTQDNQWQNVQNYWLTRGWNVGIFQWTQLADDDWGPMPVDTEKKIYDANSRNVGMRWKSTTGAFSPRGNPTNNLTQIYRAAYLQVASAQSTSAEIRLIGNSLGGNLSIAMGRELAINGSRLPRRITLQDPYWDGELNGADGMTVPGGLASNRVVGQDGAARLSNAGVAIEYVRSSLAGQQGYNRPVAQIASYVNFVPGYTSDIGAKHTQPTRQYLWAYDFAGTVASARTPHDTVRSRMATNNFWDHVGGTNTATPGDDTYVTRTGKP